MTKSQYDIIKKSHWIEADSCSFFNFNQSTPQHLIFELVMINVSISFRITYREMLDCKPSSPMFIPLAISYILIDRIFKHTFNMEQPDRKVLIGFGNYHIIEEYHRLRTTC